MILAEVKQQLTKACVQVGLKEVYLNNETINDGSDRVALWVFQVPNLHKAVQR
jgi:hypothetical protein